jgi:hypothetical protein
MHARNYVSARGKYAALGCTRGKTPPRRVQPNRRLKPPARAFPYSSSLPPAKLWHCPAVRPLPRRLHSPPPPPLLPKCFLCIKSALSPPHPTRTSSSSEARCPRKVAMEETLWLMGQEKNLFFMYINLCRDQVLAQKRMM